MQLACRIVYSIFSSDCVCEYGICGRTGTPLKILTALQVLSLPKRHKQVVSTNWAKYHQTGQADTRWKPVWKWRERDAKLCHEAAAFKAVPFENHPITVSSADYSKKNNKSLGVSGEYLHISQVWRSTNHQFWLHFRKCCSRKYEILFRTNDGRESS